MIVLFQQDTRRRAFRLFACWLVLLLSLIMLGRNVVRMDGWRDHGLFYYAPRLLLHGQNAYNRDRMEQEWRNDGMPAGVNPEMTMSGYVMPPGMGLLTLPASFAPPQFAYRAIDAWNLAALGVCLFFLLKMAGRRWPLEVRILFAAFVLSMPDVSGMLAVGQSTLIICACLCGACYALSKRSNGAGGAAIGLALAKFTLSLPFFALLLYRRKWKAFLVALILFSGVNLAFAAPYGVLKSLREYRTVMARENQPGSSYDAISSNPTYMPDTLVNGKRLLYLLLGRRRTLIEAFHIIFSLAAAGVMACLLRPREKPNALIERPLEIALLVLAGLLLFYHRSYDLAALLMVSYAVIDEGIREPAQRNFLWILMLALLALLTHTTPLAFGILAPVFSRVGIPTAICWLNCLLLAGLFIVCACQLYCQQTKEPPTRTVGDI